MASYRESWQFCLRQLFRLKASIKRCSLTFVLREHEDSFHKELAANFDQPRIQVHHFVVLGDGVELLHLLCGVKNWAGANITCTSLQTMGQVFDFQVFLLVESGDQVFKCFVQGHLLKFTQEVVEYLLAVR